MKMRTSIYSTVLMGVATIAVCFGCASKKVVAQDPLPAAGTDTDTITKYDITPPAQVERNANSNAKLADLGAGSSGRSR